jgi:hypothetical protein
LRNYFIIAIFILFSFIIYSEPEKRFSLYGKIINIENSYLLFETFDGKTVRLRLAPDWFIKANNFPISPSDRIKIEVFELENANSLLQVSKIEIRGKEYVFVDSNYNILWKRKGFFNKKTIPKENDIEKEEQGKPAD